MANPGVCGNVNVRVCDPNSCDLLIFDDCNVCYCHNKIGYFCVRFCNRRNQIYTIVVKISDSFLSVHSERCLDLDGKTAATMAHSFAAVAVVLSFSHCRIIRALSIDFASKIYWRSAMSMERFFLSHSLFFHAPL